MTKQEGQSARKKDAEWLKAHLIRVDPPYSPNRKTSAGLSTASAKPAARTAIRRLYDLDESMGAWIRGGDGENACTIKDEWIITGQEIIRQTIKALEAPPAAERTALKKIQETIEARLSAISMPKGSSTEDTLRWVLSLFDAQERAGAKA